MTIRARLKHGILRLELPIQKPRASTSGKTRVVATTGGQVNTGIEYYGSEIVVVANAFIENLQSDQKKNTHHRESHKQHN